MKSLPHLDRPSPASRVLALALLAGCIVVAGCVGPPASYEAPRSGARSDQPISAQGQDLAVNVVGDGIPSPLEDRIGDATRGKTLLVERESANCVLCHALPQLGLRFAGNIGPSLETSGRKFSPAQLRLRIVDSTRLDAAATMPSYYRVDGLDRVAAQYRGQPILDAQQVEDVIAYLAQLR